MSNYIAVVGFATDKLDPEGNPKIKKHKFLIAGETFYEAHMNLIEYLKDSASDNDIISMAKANFEDILSVKSGKVVAMGA